MGITRSQEVFKQSRSKFLEGQVLSAHLFVVEIRQQAGITSSCITAGAVFTLQAALIFGFLLLADDLYATLTAVMLA